MGAWSAVVLEALIICLVGGRMQTTRTNEGEEFAEQCVAETVNTLTTTSDSEVSIADLTQRGALASSLASRIHHLAHRSVITLRCFQDVPFIPRLKPYCDYDKSEIFLITIDTFDHSAFSSTFNKLQLLRFWHYQARVIVAYSDQIRSDSFTNKSLEERIFSVFHKELFLNVFLIKYITRTSCSQCSCVSVYTYNPYKNRHHSLKPEKLYLEDLKDYDISLNLFGFPLRLAMVDIEPYIFIRKDKYNRSILQGQDGILIRETLNKMNATYVILRPDDHLPHGFFINKTINGIRKTVLNGAMGMTAYGESDLAANSWLSDPPWRFLVEYIYPHDQDNYCVLVRKSKKVPFHRLLFMPFTSETWDYLAITFLITSVFRVFFRHGVNLWKTYVCFYNKEISVIFTTIPDINEEHSSTTHQNTTPGVSYPVCVKRFESGMKTYTSLEGRVINVQGHCQDFIKLNKGSQSFIRSQRPNACNNTFAVIIRKMHQCCYDSSFVFIKKRKSVFKQTKLQMYFNSRCVPILKGLSIFLILWGNSILETYRIFINGAFGVLPNSLSDRILLGALGFASITLTYSYNGVITSYLTTPVYESEIETLQEVNSNFEKIYSYPYFLTMFADVNSNDVSKLKKKFVATLTEAEWGAAMEEVRLGAAAALLRRTRASFFAHLRKGRTHGRLRLVKETALSPAHAQLAVKSNSPLLRAFDRHFAHAAAGGLTEHWRTETSRFYVLKKVAVSKEFEEREIYEKQVLSTQQIQTVFYILAAGLALAMTVFLAETIFWQMQQCQKGKWRSERWHLAEAVQTYWSRKRNTETNR